MGKGVDEEKNKTSLSDMSATTSCFLSNNCSTIAASRQARARLKRAAKALWVTRGLETSPVEDMYYAMVRWWGQKDEMMM